MRDRTTLHCRPSARLLQIRQYHTTSVSVLILCLWRHFDTKVGHCTQGQFVYVRSSWFGWSLVSLKTYAVVGNTYFYCVTYNRELIYFVFVYEYYYVRHTVKFSTCVRQSFHCSDAKSVVILLLQANCSRCNWHGRSETYWSSDCKAVFTGESKWSCAVSFGQEIYWESNNCDERWWLMQL